METLKNKKVGTFGTLGAYPDSEHAQKCVEKISEALKANGNTVVAEFICQGAIDPKIIETKPITNTIITPPTSLNEISFITNILANP